MTLDEYIAARSARDPEFAAALAVLRELVEGNGLTADEFGHHCIYCEADGKEIDTGKRYPWGGIDWELTCDHDDDCPIRHGRDLLARLAAGEGA